MKLYEITQAYRSLADRIDSYEEIPEELEQQLAQIEANLDDKFDAYCALRREFEAEAEASRIEAKRLQALAQVRQNAADRIWKALATELQNMGMERHRTSRFHAYFQKNPPGCKVESDPRFLPVQYQRIKIEADSKALVEAWKDGLTLPPGVTVEQGVSLRLK